MSDSFWTEGPKRLREALFARRLEIDILFARLREVDSPEERREIEAELHAILEEYSPSDEEIGGALFFIQPKG